MEIELAVEIEPAVLFGSGVEIELFPCTAGSISTAGSVNTPSSISTGVTLKRLNNYSRLNFKFLSSLRESVLKYNVFNIIPRKRELIISAAQLSLLY